jgi:predicted dehydrogenase
VAEEQTPNVDRRDFMKTSAVAGTAMTLAAATYSRAAGSNDRIGVAFVGTGGRCQAHLKAINEMVKANKGVAPVAVCDVWDGHEDKYKDANGKEQTYSQGLYPSAKTVGLNPDDKKHVVKDYRRILELKEADVVFIGTPDHWHAKISIDAAAAGKDVYCEKPMTKTIDEAIAVADAMRKHNRVMTVGVQSMAEPRWKEAYELIRSGKIGHVAQAQTSYYRNSSMGQWRYYRLYREMNPKTVDWDMFLGHNFRATDSGPPLGPGPNQMPFDRAVFGQWRCYWPFGGGMFTDLFVHQTTHMIAAMGVRFPARVVGGGGLYLEYDGRDVPDVSAIVADYDEGCQLLVTATMINEYPIEEVIRGKLGTIKFTTRDNMMGYEHFPEKVGGGPGRPKVPGELKGELKATIPYHDTTPELWADFLECVRSRKRETLSTPDLGAAAFSTVAMGVKSYREGKALFWDKEQRKPVEADPSWASRWEARSKQHGEPSQIMGWQGDDAGSTLTPESYQKLAGPWVNGKDPAGNA